MPTSPRTNRTDTGLNNNQYWPMDAIPQDGSQYLKIGELENGSFLCCDEAGTEFVGLSRPAAELESLRQRANIHDENLTRNVATYLTSSPASEEEAVVIDERCTGGSVRSRMQERTLSLPDIENIATSVLGGLRCLHSQLPPLPHGSLSPEKMEFGADGIVKLVHWGLMSDDEPATYWSPERRSNRRPSVADDMWAFGLVLTEMLTGLTRFGDSCGEEQLASSLPQPRLAPFSPLLHRLLARDPSVRPSAAEANHLFSALLHPYPRLPLSSLFGEFHRMRRCFVHMESFAPGQSAAEWEHGGDGAAACGHKGLFDLRVVEWGDVQKLTRIGLIRDKKLELLRHCLEARRHRVAWFGAHLLHAVYYDSLEALRLLIELGADVNGVDSKGWTALGVAAQKNKPECATVLLEGGADVERGRVSGGSPPLHVASQKGAIEVMRVLLAHHADVHAVKTESGLPPLATASRCGHPECVRLLLEHGANPDYGGEEKDAPILVAAKNDQLDCLRVLLDFGASPAVRDRDGCTVLHIACRQGSTECVEYLLAHGGEALVNDSGAKNQTTPLLAAVSVGAEECAHLLLAHGADVHQPAAGAHSPLHQAALNAPPSMVAMLLAHGADPKAADELGATPLHHATTAMSGESMELLLAAGADVNARTRTGFTPLHIACEVGFDEGVDLLLENGAEVSARAHDGSDALFLAVACGYASVCERLLMAGADSNTRRPQPVAHNRVGFGGIRLPIFWDVDRVVVPPGQSHAAGPSSRYGRQVCWMSLAEGVEPNGVHTALGLACWLGFADCAHMLLFAGVAPTQEAEDEARSGLESWEEGGVRRRVGNVLTDFGIIP